MNRFFMHTSLPAAALRRGGVSLILACALAVAGCAETAPTSELVRARSAYDAARTGPAKTLEQDRLEAAKAALDAAESEHADDPGSEKERHLAYIATRAAEMAGVYGQIAANERDTKLAARDFAAVHASLKKRADFQLANAEAQATIDDDARERIIKTLQNELSRSQSEGRVDATDRGVIITLPSAPLFASDGSTLLPGAKDQLFQIAMALQSLDPDRIIMVAGHTDANGSDTFNQRLSTARAEAIRSYFISQGVSRDRVRAIGEGATRPVGDSGTAEGRDANRRIEIVIPLERRAPETPEPTSSR